MHLFFGFFVFCRQSDHKWRLKEWALLLCSVSAVRCPILGNSNVSAGSLNCSHPIARHSYNSTCETRCDTGYEPIGQQQIRCDQGGQWTASVPTCRGNIIPHNILYHTFFLKKLARIWTTSSSIIGWLTLPTKLCLLPVINPPKKSMVPLAYVV